MLLPLAAGAGVIAAPLIQPAAVAYWLALHYWNMTEHIPSVIFVQSTPRKRPLEVLGMRSRFITVKEAHFFGVIQHTVDRQPIYVTNREKTLLRCGDTSFFSWEDWATGSIPPSVLFAASSGLRIVSTTCWVVRFCGQEPPSKRSYSS